MNAAAAQYPISQFKSFQAWQTHITQWVRAATNQKAQLLLFPEYGSLELISLFSPTIQACIHQQIEALNDLKDDFCDVFAQLAKRFGVVIVAPSLPFTVSDEVFNRSFVFSAKGLVGYQDKFFMTRFEDESWQIKSAPKILTVFEADWGRFGIQICYDAEFALGSALLAQHGAEMILVPSCTETAQGAARVHTGARARALENQAYVLVSQTVGKAIWSPVVDINYGYAAAYSTPDKGFPVMGVLKYKRAQKIGWLVVDLDFLLIQSVRAEGNVLNWKSHQALKLGFEQESIQIIQNMV
ncbi:MAG: nitrilase [Cytophagales bacterium]|nr:MAG: nitrilase [Cytophagales bacterium]TAF60404.1 MAG: nitrilase [Cytophagales bacterium]